MGDVSEPVIAGLTPRETSYYHGTTIKTSPALRRSHVSLGQSAVQCPDLQINASSYFYLSFAKPDASCWQPKAILSGASNNPDRTLTQPWDI